MMNEFTPTGALPVVGARRVAEPAVMQAVVAQPVVAPLVPPGVARRDDVVMRKGLFTLLNSTLTPQDAMVEDLFFVRGVLDAAGIPFFLVRGERDRPVLAVDWRVRKKVRMALADACRDEPFYARADDDPVPLLVAAGRLSRRGRSRGISLYRPRVDPRGRLRYGARSGLRLEFWQWNGDSVIAPSENAITRHVIQAHELQPDSTVQYGREWPTFDGMFGAHASDITFDIDIVFSWVDGASVQWQRERAKRMESYVVGEGDAADARFRQIDELRYALRSVNLFAPWIRQIFIVTDSPVPEWLDSHPRVTIVRSEDFFLDPSVLPTHNSHAIEAQLHHIDGLSEHFLYSNDDMFFGRPVTPDMFFSPGGLTKFIEATTRIGLGGTTTSRSGFENAARVNRQLLATKFGRITTRHLEHAATPLRRSVLLELEQQFPEEFRRTSASRFRSATDISVTNSLYHYFALMSGRAVVQTGARVRYVDTTLRTELRDLRRLLKRRSVDFFCLNDGSFPEVDAAERAVAVRAFLQSYFPIPAPWERLSPASSDHEPGIRDAHR